MSAMPLRAQMFLQQNYSMLVLSDNHNFAVIWQILFELNYNSIQPRDLKTHKSFPLS
jgi:hypothetical protein